MTSRKMVMLDYNPFWIYLVQKPFGILFDAVDKVMDGKLTGMMVEADIWFYRQASGGDQK